MTSIGVIGAGPMGAGIAQVAAVAGYSVVLVDRDPAIAAAAMARIHEALEREVTKGRSDPADCAAARERLKLGEEADLGDADLVIEAIVENLDAKTALLRRLRGIARRAILATNTSSLSIRTLAARSGCPGLVGLHFFNPVPRMRLVEVIAPDSRIELLRSFAESLGKTPVRAADSPGFIVNRCARPFYHEAHRMLDAGIAGPAEIDSCLRTALGVPLGPFELIDLIGLDVNAASSRQIYEALGRPKRLKPSARLEALVKAGRLGRKSGEGFYTYPAPSRPTGTPADRDVMIAALRAIAPVAETDGRTASERANGGALILIDIALGDWAGVPRVACALSGLDPDQTDAIRAVGAAHGVALLPVGDTPGLIGLRMAAQIVNEARFAVAEGVASLDDITIAMRLGLNFRHGPGTLIDTLGPSLDRTLDRLHQHDRRGAYLAAPKRGRARTRSH